MGNPQPLRADLASICRYLAPRREDRVVRDVPRTGILAQLASGQGLQ